MSVVLCLPAHLRVSTAASRGRPPTGTRQDLLISKKPLKDDPQIYFTQPIIQDQGKPLYFRGWVNLTEVDVNMQTMTMNLTVILQMLQPEQPPTLASHSPQPHSNPETTPSPPP